MPADDPELLAARLCSVRPIARFGDGRPYELTPTVLLELDDGLAAAIAAICNEPIIHTTLFADVLDGRAYASEDALRFLEWGAEGWERGTHFVYLLLDDASRVAGAIDIKSGDMASAEIGYWLGAEHRGIMTNAVTELSELARESGFVALHALVRPENGRSSRVLERAGFVRTVVVERNGRAYDRYERRL